MDADVKNAADFAKLLKQLRLRHGWTRIQLYLRLNELSSKEQIIGFDSIERWESGRQLPKIEATLALSRVFHMPELIQMRVNIIELQKRLLAQR
jgi:transcriptional regulator with XRE-family HTH domain